MTAEPVAIQTEARARSAAHDLAKRHAKTKAVRQRGAEAPNHLAVQAYLRSLEKELDAVCVHIAEAYALFDRSRDFRKCSVHMDRAQQRLHRVIKKIARKK